MTDRHSGYIVTLHQDTREDDAQATIDAINMIKGVLNVQPITTTTEIHLARATERHALREKIFTLLEETSHLNERTR